jgi:hypothetical protein
MPYQFGYKGIKEVPTCLLAKCHLQPPLAGIVGFEPTRPSGQADQALRLPFRHGPIIYCVGIAGFEPALSRIQTERPTKLAYTPLTVGNYVNLEVYVVPH